MRHSPFRFYCPHCGASTFAALSKVCDISWNDKKKEFIVKLKLAICTQCNRSDKVTYASNAVLISIPTAIAQESTCSCGAPMALGDHRIIKESNDIIFEGQYACTVCNRKSNTLISKIAAGLINFWNKTKRIEIGPDGISYEKDTAEGED